MRRENAGETGRHRHMIRTRTKPPPPHEMTGDEMMTGTSTRGISPPRLADNEDAQDTTPRHDTSTGKQGKRNHHARANETRTPRDAHARGKMKTTAASHHPETTRHRKQTEPPRRRNDNSRSREQATAIIRTSPPAADADTPPANHHRAANEPQGE